jgi:hypothetical protein
MRGNAGIGDGNGHAAEPHCDREYLYAVGHANGAATVIQSRGPVPGTFDDPVYFRWVPISLFDVANGD